MQETSIVFFLSFLTVDEGLAGVDFILSGGYLKLFDLIKLDFLSDLTRDGDKGRLGLQLKQAPTRPSPIYLLFLI
jgi:hypothetical protein